MILGPSHGLLLIMHFENMADLVEAVSISLGLQVNRLCRTALELRRFLRGARLLREFYPWLTIEQLQWQTCTL